LGPQLATREWLLANGLGGYALGTVAGIPTRRYHGLLIAALQAPSGRVVMLNHAAEEIRFPNGTVASLTGWASADGRSDLDPARFLREFRLEDGLPMWHFVMGDYALEKRVVMPYRQNTVCVDYRWLSGEGQVELRIRPWLHFRSHEVLVAGHGPRAYIVAELPPGIEIRGPDVPALRLRFQGPAGSMVFDGERTIEVFYPVESQRGYDAEDSLWSAGYFRVDLSAGQQATLIASTESWDALSAIDPEEAFHRERERRAGLVAAAHPRARTGAAAQLVLAADQFVVAPVARSPEARTIIAGYPWFTDWGRDTMISLEGLTLITGRYAEAASILRDAAANVRDGLIPNLFPEGQHEGLYNTADATLWYFHALDRYVAASGDRTLVADLWPTLRSIVEHHQRGTQFNIHVDPGDGLLVQGRPGDQLSWMDAKVGDWVVTPRHGKAVEINALWYNALRLMERWAGEQAGTAAARPYAEAAQRTADAFNLRFWYAPGGYLFDVVDSQSGDDRAMRPNQILAVSLPHPILIRERWASVVDRVAQRLLTPVGLRTLASDEPDYHASYTGDLRSRDAAYHQGTVWAWLIGPFVDAWCKVHPHHRHEACKFLNGFASHWCEAGVGSISEIFDAEAPHTPRGCIAQAWSVAEVLRVWVGCRSLDQG
jgi:predicted glycogen debranching enzyme